MISVTWSVDATSNKGVPATGVEWSQLLQAYGIAGAPPAHLWPLQDSSGDALDVIGNASLSPVNGPSYRNTVAGWSRFAVGTQDLDADQGFISSQTGNLNGASYLLLAYIALVTTPTQDRSVLGIGASTDHRCVAVTPTPVLKGTGAGVTPAVGSVNPMMSVHPIVIRLNPTALTYTVFTDEEKIDVPWRSTAGVGNLVIIGNALIGSANARYLYAAMWAGASAELDNANVKKLLQGLGWTVTGY